MEIDDIVARARAAKDGGAEAAAELGEALVAAGVPASDFVEAASTLDAPELVVAVLRVYDEHWRRRERLATIGQLSAAVGHDIRNPLGVIGSSLFLLRRRPDTDAKMTKHLDKIARQVSICEQIVIDLLDMARDNPPRVVTIDVGEAMRGAVEEAEPAEAYRVAIEVEDGLVLQADRGLLRRALVNLIANAVRALGPAGGTITLRGASEGPDEACLSVLDDGPGFDASVLRIAFEPLVTTRSSGVGLGLALVRSIVLRHRGRAEASNRPEGGARVDLLLPRTHGP